ncbi:sulfurtransferase TusA family protein [Verrucomicrobiota bacterium]
MKQQFYNLPGDLGEDIELYAENVARFCSGDLSPSLFKAGRVPRGVYEQRKDGTYMVRVRVAGGTITSEQGQVLSEISKAFGSSQLHVTTRQDVQLHDIRIEDTPEIMRRLMPVGLTSKGGGGNTVRNIAACPYAGICPAEKFDVTPFAHAVTEYLIALKGSYNLPRKYKIAFSGCDKDCALARVSDLGFIAKTSDGKPGFIVYAGGGLGTQSRPGDFMEEWIPAAEVIRFAEGVRRLFDQLGDRKQRNRARLRFVFERIGMNAFRETLHDLLYRIKDVPDCKTEIQTFSDISHDSAGYRLETDAESGIRFIPQRQNGYVAVPLHLPMGFISSDDFKTITKISEMFSQEKGFRTTRSQNLILRFIKKEDLASLGTALKELSYDALKNTALESFTACAGASTCRLGLCLSRHAARACAEAFEKTDVKSSTLNALDIRISGCPNSCGQHPVASIGLFGAAQRKRGRLVPSYHVILGARNDKVHARLGQPAGMVPAHALPELLIDLAKDFQEKHKKHESFADYFERQKIEHFNNIVKQHANIPSYSNQPEYYRDWEQNEDFSLAGRGAGECGAGVFEVINEDIITAGKMLEKAGQNRETADLFDAFLPTARALLITRGIDSQDPKEIIYAFEKHFLDTGLVHVQFRSLLSRARGYLEGWQDALANDEAEVQKLLERVKLLFSTLDANLNFHPPDSESSVNILKTEKNEESLAKLDLRGVACPMNFVKAKLKLETMKIGQTLEIILDDGEPVQNVPASFKGEGQEISGMDNLGNGHWLIKVKKNH